MGCLTRKRNRLALLVIKVKPGIRARRSLSREDTDVSKGEGGGEGKARGALAISEMAVKINEWKSSLSFSSRDASRYVRPRPVGEAEHRHGVRTADETSRVGQ